MKAYTRSGSISPLMLHLSTRWRYVVSLICWLLTPRKRATGTHWKRGWVSSRAGLDTLEKTWISCPCQDSNPVLSSPWPSYYTDYAILASSVMPIFKTESNYWICIILYPQLFSPFLTKLRNTAVLSSIHTMEMTVPLQSKCMYI
jgi:hypothetical protein